MRRSFGKNLQERPKWVWVYRRNDAFERPTLSAKNDQLNELCKRWNFQRDRACSPNWLANSSGFTLLWFKEDIFLAIPFSNCNRDFRVEAETSLRNGSVLWYRYHKGEISSMDFPQWRFSFILSLFDHSDSVWWWHLSWRTSSFLSLLALYGIFPSTLLVISTIDLSRFSLGRRRIL